MEIGFFLAGCETATKQTVDTATRNAAHNDWSESEQEK